MYVLIVYQGRKKNQMENIEDYVNKMLFDDAEEVANHNVNDTALPAMPPHHAVRFLFLQYVSTFISRSRTIQCS